MRDAIAIGGRLIGQSEPPYIIAELSGNHNGDITRALRLIEAAKEAGADAVKLQTYTADTITIDHNGPGFLITEGPWSGRSLYELYKEAHTPWEWHPALFARCRELALTVFSSPFDETAIEFLEGLDVPAYKIASFEIIDIPLIRCAAATGKPLIISTGMATVAEIADALNAAQSGGAAGVVLLHCVSGYPTPIEDVNLATVQDLRSRFDVPIGLSDHTLSTAVPVAAVALGAAVIEKHLTLRRSDGGPDAAFSLEPDELKCMVRDCHTSWKALGRATYERERSELPNVIFRRSLYVVTDVRRGEEFTSANVRSIRPGYGMPPKELTSVLGRRAARDIARGTPLSPDLIAR